MHTITESEFKFICNLLAGRMSTEIDNSEIAVRDTLSAYLANVEITTSNDTFCLMIEAIMDSM